MRRLRQIAAIGLAGMLTMSLPLSAWAAESDYDAATWARLQDNALEYDEIPNLVVEYNPMYKSMMQGIAFSTSPMTAGISDMRNEADEYTELAKEQKDGGNPMLEEIYRKGASELRKNADKMERSLASGTRLSVNRTRKSLTSAVQGLMVQYNNLLSTKRMLESVVTLSQAAYDSARVQMGLQMATVADVQNAQKNLLNAQANLQAVNDGVTALRQNLCIMTGWSYDANPEIGVIPSPDMGRIGQMNPETDIKKAISNNYDLIDKKHVVARGSAASDARERTIEEAESLLRTNLDTLYQTVLRDRSAYEAMSTAYQGARLEMNGANLKYQLGSIGRLEHLSAQMNFEQQKMQYEQAGLTLFQSMLNYDWAVEGLAEIQ